MIPMHASISMCELDGHIQKSVKDPFWSPWRERFTIRKMYLAIGCYSSASLTLPSKRSIQLSKKMKEVSIGPTQYIGAELERLFL